MSPDGGSVAYTVATPNLETNEADSNVWVADVRRRTSRQVTFSNKDRSAQWSPDGMTLAFLSRRGGKSQVYVMSSNGGAARAITDMPSHVETLRWSPAGDMLVVSTVVDPTCADERCLRDSAARLENDKSPRTYDRLPTASALRWLDRTRSHLFAISADGSTPPRDLTPGDLHYVPARHSADGSAEPDAIAISPDGQEVCFVSAAEYSSDGQPLLNLYVVPMAGGTPKRLLPASGFNRGPTYSPDGRFIAYRSRLDPKNAGQRYRLMLYQRESGQLTELAKSFDRDPSTLTWARNGKELFFLAEDAHQQPLFALKLDANAEPRQIAGGFNSELSAARSAEAIAFTRSTSASPAELFAKSSLRAEPRQITEHTKSVMATLRMATPESFWFPSTAGSQVHALYVAPPQVVPGKTYPLVVLLHGGPTAMWGNSWTYRWNAQVFAAPGYGVLMINRRGSTGYGDKFSTAISNDWGGAPYADIMSGVDATLERYTYLDAARVAVAGASYGGYLANWVATHTDRFKTIVSHAGVFDLASVYAMEAPWWLENEFGGTPWESPASYAKWSPSSHAAALGKFKTPMLVTVGERDFRVPYMQSVLLFAALSRQGVPSKLVVFPDEGHWILKPQNSRHWYTTTLGWLAEHLEGGKQ